MKRNGKNKKDKNKKAHHENPLPGDIAPKQRKENADALQEADKDIKDDPEFTAHSKNDVSCYEGESARLGEKNSLI